MSNETKNRHVDQKVDMITHIVQFCLVDQLIIYLGSDWTNTWNYRDICALMRSNYSQYIQSEALSNGLKCLKFGHYFNQPLNDFNFPENLTRLEFGNWFDQSLSEERMPKNLTLLKLGDTYAQPLSSNLIKLAY